MRAMELAARVDTGSPATSISYQVWKMVDIGAATIAGAGEVFGILGRFFFCPIVHVFTGPVGWMSDYGLQDPTPELRFESARHIWQVTPI